MVLHSNDDIISSLDEFLIKVSKLEYGFQSKGFIDDHKAKQAIRELLIVFNKEMEELHSWFLPADDSMIDEFLNNF